MGAQTELFLKHWEEEIIFLFNTKKHCYHTNFCSKLEGECEMWKIYMRFIQHE